MLSPMDDVLGPRRTHIFSKLNNFHMGIVKEVPARLLDRVEDFFIYSTRAVTESLNRIKVSR